MTEHTSPGGASVGTDSGAPNADPREMAGGTGSVPQPLEKYGTTPEAAKNPSWLRRVFLGEPGARHPDVFLKRLSRAFNSPTTGFYGLSHDIGYALDSMFEGSSRAYEDSRVSEELKYVGTARTPRDCSETQTRKEGVAVYVRRWLSGDPSLAQVAPTFTSIWDRWMESDDLAGVDRGQRDALKRAKMEIDVYQGLTPEEQFTLHCQFLPRSVALRTADGVQRVRDEGVIAIGSALVRTWGPGVMFCLALLLLMYAALSYQRSEPHLFTIDDPSGQPITVECWLDERAAGVDIYIVASDGHREPIEYHFFDSPDVADGDEALAEWPDVDALMGELGLPRTVPHLLRDAAVAACEKLAPTPLSPEAIEALQAIEALRKRE